MNDHIFFVDDEKNILTSIKRLFRHSKLNIHIYTSAIKALKDMQDVSPAVVVSDYRMPEMTGIEFLNKVQEENPQSIRIILSAFTDIAIAESAINKNIVHWFFQKPWDEKELVSDILSYVKLYNTNYFKEQSYGIFGE